MSFEEFDEILILALMVFFIAWEIIQFLHGRPE